MRVPTGRSSASPARSARHGSHTHRHPPFGELQQVAVIVGNGAAAEVAALTLRDRPGHPS